MLLQTSQFPEQADPRFSPWRRELARLLRPPIGPPSPAPRRPQPRPQGPKDRAEPPPVAVVRLRTCPPIHPSWVSLARHRNTSFFSSFRNRPPPSHSPFSFAPAIAGASLPGIQHRVGCCWLVSGQRAMKRVRPSPSYPPSRNSHDQNSRVECVPMHTQYEASTCHGCCCWTLAFSAWLWRVDL